jgi:quaternary ammonium compound-resistance protein SugE
MEKHLAWTYLVIAGVVEIAWSMSMKYTKGFTQLGPTLLSIVLAVGSVMFLNKAITVLPVGTAYAVWMAIGTIGTAIFGIVMFRESTQWPRLLCIAFIAGGAIGLKILDKN